MTISISSASGCIKNWHVSEEESLSDHRHIIFEIETPLYEIQSNSVSKTTDWEEYNARYEPLENMSAENEPSFDHMTQG